LKIRDVGAMDIGGFAKHVLEIIVGVLGVV
jgi:hypothetical protein